jgi:hypothetical protein
MADSAIDYVNLTRICEFTPALRQVHQIGGDEDDRPRVQRGMPGDTSLLPAWSNETAGPRHLRRRMKFRDRLGKSPQPGRPYV